MSAYAWIALGAVFGTAARYFLSRFLAENFPPAFPYGTLLVNISGSLLLGFFLVWTTERALVDPRWRLLVAIGLCGSYTTFSSFAFETVSYIEQGHWFLLAINLFANNILCIAAVLAGAALARWI